VDENSTPHDWESTTSILKRRAPGLGWFPGALRQRLTPAALWTAVTLLAAAIAYVLSARHEIHDAQTAVLRLQASVSHLEEERDVLHKIDTQLAVMNSKVDDIATEVDRQREWRERIEDAAELPPHAVRRRK
jgi:outer membrane murein-binding lipoprotein Lpp